jgi:predicted RecA/RadA family phage recombinase
MPSCFFVHQILQSKGQKAPKSGAFKNEGIHELPKDSRDDPKTGKWLNIALG